MNNWRIKFTEKLYLQLRFFLFRDKTLENGCFLKIKNIGATIYVKEIIKPLHDDWVIKEEGRFMPNSRYILHALNIAEKDNMSLIFVHTHPLPNHPTGFSSMDVYSNQLLFENIYPILKQPIGSLVFTFNTIHGVIYSDNYQEEIESYHVIGKNYNKILDVGQTQKKIDSELLDRQLRFVGETKQNLISQLKIVVVGAGGIGSPLVFQLGKIGVKNISVFDGDKIELSNLARIYGAEKKNIGKSKVDVLKQFVEKYTNAEVHAFPIYLKREHPNLIEADIIFGALDNHTARDFLNSVSIEYGIPYIDAACAIPIDSFGSVLQAPNQISVVSVGGPCLWCMGVLDANKIREEGLLKEEKEKLKAEGYYSGIDKVPSVIFQTTSVASGAISRMFNLLGILDNNYPVKTVHEMSTGFINDFELDKNPKCPFHEKHPF